MGKRLTTEQFVERAVAIHGDKYDYSKVIYDRSHEKVCIICPDHGEFWQRPSDHWNNHGCSKCGDDRNRIAITLTTEEFIERAVAVHGDKYDYSKVEYIGNKREICIICPDHGEFWQIPNTHLMAHHCPDCSKARIIKIRTLTTEEFIERASIINGCRYDYKLVDYTGVFEKVCIICPDHGEFWQRPADHINNCTGCPTCGYLISSVSKPEQEITKWLSNFTTVETSDRKLLGGKELDIILPELKVAIEYNGLYWHTERTKPRLYHSDKTKACNTEGYRLIHVWEDDYTRNPNKILLWLTSVLNLLLVERIGGRKCTVQIIDHLVASKFHDDFHIQSSVRATIHLGLFHDDVLCSVASYLKTSSIEYNLVRYTNRPGIKVIGGYAKLQAAFVRMFPDCKEIVTFADLSWVDSTKNTYEYHGFKRVHDVPVDYKYVVGGERKHKFGYRHKDLQRKLKNYDPLLTERENCLNNNIYRIYDCGKIKYCNTIL